MATSELDPRLSTRSPVMGVHRGRARQREPLCQVRKPTSGKHRARIGMWYNLGTLTLMKKGLHRDRSDLFCEALHAQLVEVTHLHGCPSAAAQAAW